MKAFVNIGFTMKNPPASYTGERRAEYIARRNFYNLSAEYNAYSYFLDHKKVVKNANAEHYFTREGTNTGLFNMDGAISEKHKQEIKEHLKNSDSIIWHGFISFDNETTLGFRTQENCIKFMHSTFGGFLERAGFRKDNIELFCSLHEDTEHRHIHFEFYEKQPMKLNKNGVLQYTRVGKIKPEVLDNYLVSANMHLSEYAEEYYSARDKAIAELNRIREIKTRTGFVDGRAKTAALLVNVELMRLCNKLPASGRLQYNSADMARLRPEIDRVAEVLINNDVQAKTAHARMIRELARIKNEVKELAEAGKLGYAAGERLTAAQIKLIMGGETKNRKMPVSYVDLNRVDYFERLQEDYKARVGNVILAICKDIKRSERQFDRRYFRVNDKRMKIEAKRRRGHKRDLLRAAQRAMAAMCNQDSANYLKTVKQHENDITFEEEEAKRVGE